MARRVIESLLDDLDGSEADETIRFAVDGRLYEIDLSESHAQELRDFLVKYREAGRRVAAGVTASYAPGQTASVSQEQKERNREIRAWAVKHKLAVSDRGRISAEIVDKYNDPEARRQVEAAAAQNGKAAEKPKAPPKAATPKAAEFVAPAQAGRRGRRPAQAAR